MKLKVGMNGLPCSGKTTSAYKLQAKLSELGVNAMVVPEYARMYIKHHGKPDAEGQSHIAMMQSNLERHLESQDPDVLICEAPVFLNAAYMHYYHGDSENVSSIKEVSDEHDYDVVFWNESLSYEEDGVRYQTEEELEQIKEFLVDLDKGDKKIKLVGSPEERLRQMLEHISDHIDLEVKK